MKCYYCGSELNEKATYCLNCGKKVGDTDNNFSKKGEYVGKGEPISKKKYHLKKGKLPLSVRMAWSIAMLLVVVLAICCIKS